MVVVPMVVTMALVGVDGRNYGAHILFSNRSLYPGLTSRP
ncbi:hypothetical protein APV28_1207 [Comamonas testosteroni]|nr:hypothetical protein APV28_1207 [Comamonas testosteroni]